MRSSLSVNFQDDIVADIKKIGHNVSGALGAVRRGLSAATAAKLYPNDKDAIKRILSED